MEFSWALLLTHIAEQSTDATLHEMVRNALKQWVTISSKGLDDTISRTTYFMLDRIERIRKGEVYV